MTSTNPFQPPTDASDRDVTGPSADVTGPSADVAGASADVAGGPVLRDVALFSANQCAGATLLGGPLAGLGLVAWNELSLGRRERAVSWAAGAVAFTLLLVVLGIVLPASTPPYVLPIASVAAVRASVAGLEQRGYAPDVRALPRSSWLAFAAGVASLVVVLGTLVVVAVALTAAGIVPDDGT